MILSMANNKYIEGGKKKANSSEIKIDGLLI
jgi:hypothetical protein